MCNKDKLRAFRTEKTLHSQYLVPAQVCSWPHGPVFQTGVDQLQRSSFGHEILLQPADILLQLCHLIISLTDMSIRAQSHPSTATVSTLRPTCRVTGWRYWKMALSRQAGVQFNPKYKVIYNKQQALVLYHGLPPPNVTTFLLIHTVLHCCSALI